MICFRSFTSLDSVWQHIKGVHTQTHSGGSFWLGRVVPLFCWCRGVFSLGFTLLVGCEAWNVIVLWVYCGAFYKDYVWRIRSVYMLIAICWLHQLYKAPTNSTLESEPEREWVWLLNVCIACMHLHRVEVWFKLFFPLLIAVVIFVLSTNKCSTKPQSAAPAIIFN